jgi:hypothetical protein
VRRIIDPDGDATGENLQSTIFIYDGPAASPNPLASGSSQIVLQFDKEGSTSTPSNAGDTNLTHRYLWGTGVDQILADEQVHYDWTPEDYITDALLWPLGDHLGSVRDVVANNGVVRIHRAYDAYGNISSEELRNSGNQVVQPGQPGALEELFAFTALEDRHAAGFTARPSNESCRDRWLAGPTLHAKQAGIPVRAERGAQRLRKERAYGQAVTVRLPWALRAAVRPDGTRWPRHPTGIGNQRRNKLFELSPATSVRDDRRRRHRRGEGVPAWGGPR